VFNRRTEVRPEPDRTNAVELSKLAKIELRNQKRAAKSGPFHFRNKPKQENSCISMKYKEGHERNIFRINELPEVGTKNEFPAKRRLSPFFTGSTP
jgi:hypothetical protein